MCGLESSLCTLVVVLLFCIVISCNRCGSSQEASSIAHGPINFGCLVSICGFLNSCAHLVSNSCSPPPSGLEHSVVFSVI